MVDWRALSFWLVVLGCALSIEAILLFRRSRKKDRSIQRNVRALQTMVKFLEVMNALPPALDDEKLQSRLLAETRKALEPFGVHPRLWIADLSWKTLLGLGEHPALRPGSPHHLPVTACPAFALRQPFLYSQKEPDPCRSEQF